MDNRLSDKYYDKFLFRLKVLVGAALILFSFLVILTAIITGQPSALIGLIFPIFIGGLIVIFWVAGKVYDSKENKG